MESSSRRRPSRKRKNGKKTMKLTEWYPEWEQDLAAINRLPPELISMILMKLDAIHILFSAQLVCSLWYEICRDSLKWEPVDKIKINESVTEFGDNIRICDHVLYYHGFDWENCENLKLGLINQCCDRLIELDITDHNWCRLLLLFRGDQYPQLRRLRISDYVRPYGSFCTREPWKLPMLTELELSHCFISAMQLEVIGRSCPLLKSFKFTPLRYDDHYYTDDDYDDYKSFNYPVVYFKRRAFAIAATMPGLHHLVLSGNSLTNVGLQAILDGCSRLISLDIRGCRYLNLGGDLGKRCREQIQDLRGPEYDEPECSGEPKKEGLCNCGYESYDFDHCFSDVYETDDDDEDFGRQRYCYNGYIYDEYEEIVDSKKFIETGWSLVQECRVRRGDR